MAINRPKTLLLSLNMKLSVGFQLAYFHLSVAQSKGQDRTYFYSEYLCNSMMQSHVDKSRRTEPSRQWPWPLFWMSNRRIFGICSISPKRLNVEATFWEDIYKSTMDIMPSDVGEIRRDLELHSSDQTLNNFAILQLLRNVEQQPDRPHRRVHDQQPPSSRSTWTIYVDIAR